MLTREQLPNDIEQLKAIILEQQALIEQLQQQVQALLRHAYGQRSEKQKAAKPAGDKLTTSCSGSHLSRAGLAIQATFGPTFNEINPGFRLTFIAPGLTITAIM